MVLGWMSTRVLGQYDLLVIEDEKPEDQDIVYFVGPNVLALEKRFAFPPREFRHWLALHEVTHRAQFTGIPWMREHFLGLVQETVGSVDPDPKHLLDALDVRLRDEVDLAAGEQVRTYGTENLNRPWSEFRDGEDAIELPVYQGRITPATWAPQSFNA